MSLFEKTAAALSAKILSEAELGPFFAETSWVDSNADYSRVAVAGRLSVWESSLDESVYLVLGLPDDSALEFIISDEIVSFLEDLKAAVRDPGLSWKPGSTDHLLIFGEVGLVDALVRRPDGKFVYYSDIDPESFNPAAPVADIVLGETLPEILSQIKTFFD